MTQISEIYVGKTLKSWSLMYIICANNKLLAMI